jgi:hypothetical protein
MDIVVTVPKDPWWDWLDEGDLPGEPLTGEEWGFYTRGASPDIQAGERVYVVAHGRLRGYAPLSRIEIPRPGSLEIDRRGGAVALTIPELCGGRSYADLVDVVRERLSRQPAPWVIENVPGAQQLGSVPYEGGVLLRGGDIDHGFRDRKGGDMSEWPEDLRVREFPGARA